MNYMNIDFKSPEWDLFFSRWLAGEISKAERNEWCLILSKNAQFREEFCDWIKALRDPGFASYENGNTGSKAI